MVKNNEKIKQELEIAGRQYIEDLLKEPKLNQAFYSKEFLTEIAITVFIKGWSYNKERQ